MLFVLGGLCWGTVSLLVSNGAEQNGISRGIQLTFKGGGGAVKFSKNISTLQNLSPFALVFKEILKNIPAPYKFDSQESTGMSLNSLQ